MRKAMLQSLECHRRIARSGTERAGVSEHHQSPIICISWTVHCSCRAALGASWDRLPPGDLALELVL